MEPEADYSHLHCFVLVGHSDCETYGFLPSFTLSRPHFLVVFRFTQLDADTKATYRSESHQLLEDATTSTGSQARDRQRGNAATARR